MYHLIHCLVNEFSRQIKEYNVVYAHLTEEDECLEILGRDVVGYESKMYEEQLAKMPKVNSEVETPNGLGTVVYNDILRERVSVKREKRTSVVK